MDVDKLDVIESGVLTASPERWGQAESRFAVLAPLLETRPVGLSVVDDAAERLGVSRRQVYVLLDKLENGTGTVADLLVRRPSGGRGRSRVADAVEEIIAEQVGRHFLRRQKLSVAAVHRRIAVVCRRAGLPPPSRNTVAARIAALNPAAVARARGERTRHVHARRPATFHRRFGGSSNWSRSITPWSTSWSSTSTSADRSAGHT